MVNKCLLCGHYEDEIIESKCTCCGQIFQAKHTSIDFPFPRACGRTKYCENCQQKIKITDWRGHHKKEPTTKELDVEIRKLISEYTKLLYSNNEEERERKYHEDMRILEETLKLKDERKVKEKVSDENEKR